MCVKGLLRGTYIFRVLNDSKTPHMTISVCPVRSTTDSNLEKMAEMLRNDGRLTDRLENSRRTEYEGTNCETLTKYLNMNKISS